MIVPDFREIKYSNELYHFGIPRRSGRYPWGSGERPYQSAGGRSSDRVRRKEEKTRKRFDKLDKRISKKQASANIRYQRAIRKSNSLFSTKRSTRRAFEKATKAQREVERLSYRGSKYYKSYERLATKLDVPMNKELKDRGLGYLNEVVLSSKSAYQIALSRKI